MAKTIDLLKKNPIAIIGMSSMFADADNIDKFWENILLGVDSIREIPDTRWSIDDYYDPDPNVPDKTYCKVGGFIPDVDFDPMEFGLPPNILEVTDASQLLALMVAKDALIDAGYAPGSEDLTVDIKEKTGVILGVGGGQKLITPLTGRLQYPIWRRALESIGLAEDKIQEAIEKMSTAYIPWNENSFPGMLGNVISGRVANRFDFGGINCVVDAACAASLSAIKMATGELLEGRCDMMITGGVDTDNSPFMYMSFSKTPAFSQKGSIRPFDHESDGMLIGEGVGMIVCKRLDDAVRDGDRIYATINGLGSSSDGRFKSVYAPRPQGQALAMNRAYMEAGFEASSVGLIEAHGTGTVAGDLAEGKSMKMVFSDNNPDLGHIALGSVKSQIGHTKAAAGVAGIVKAALALHHKVLPGTINVTRPKPDMDIETTPFYLNSETRPWFAKSSKIPRRAGVSAFGFGGVNVHVAMEEFSDEHTENYRVHSLNKMILVHAISTHDLNTELNNRLQSLRGEGATKAFAALAKYSQEETIPKINPRVGFVASNTADAIKKFDIAIKMLGERMDETAWEHPIEGIWYRASALNNRDKVVALFSGQGSQYVNMGNSLACAYPTIRTSFQKANDLCEARKEAPLTDKVYPVPAFNDDDREKQDEELRQTQFAQPSIGALSVGMYKLFSHEGFRPDFFAGHSFGELTALWAAGAMDDDVYYKLAKSRGDAMALKGDGDAGSMLAVQGDLKDIEAQISAYADVQIANINSGKQIILGGATDSLKQLKDNLEYEGLAPKMLRVSAAFHTPFVAHAHQPFADDIAKAKFQGINKPVYSNTTGKQYNVRAPKIKETLARHMLSPVLFKEQVENMYADGARVFIEFGPKSILTNLVKDILGDQEHITVALNANPKKDSDRQLCEAAVQMAVMGMEVQGFDRFASPYHEKAEKGKMAVSISGNNYVSEGTRKKYEDLIHEATETVDVLEKPVEQEAPIKEETPVDPDNYQDGVGVDDSAPEMKVINDKQESEMTKTELEILKKLQENLERLTDKQSKIEDILVRITSGALLDSGTPPVAEPEAAKLEAASVPAPEPVVTASPAPVTAQPETTPSAAPGSVAGVDRGAIETSLLAVIAEKTGYPSEMLELSMDMEADLGIDSIKRVEIFGAMTADNPSIEGVNPQELAELRTLEQIVDYISGKAGATENPAVSQTPVVEPVPVPVAETPASTPAPTEQQAPAAEVSQPTPTSGGMDRSKVETSLLAVIAEKTGYPSEMLELTMDMESDLGIDSIKRVEIFGAMTADNPAIEGVNPQELAELRTLEQIVDYITNKAGVSSPDVSSDVKEEAPAKEEAPIATETVAEQPVTNGVETITEPVPAAASTTESIDRGQIEASLLEVIAEKTGYPSEMLELSMDMEADLGIDSIKRVEIFGAMTASNPAIDGVNPQELAELRTLDQIVDYITTKAGGVGGSDGQSIAAETVEKKKSEPSIEPQADGQIDTAANVVSSYPNVRRSDVILKFIPNPDRLEIAHEKGEITLITNEGTGLTSTLCSYLIEKGLDVAVLTFPNEAVRNSGMALPAGVKEHVLSEISDDAIGKLVSGLGGKVSQFIHLHPHFRFPMGQLGLQFDKEKDLTKATYLLAKHLKPSLNEIAEKHRTAFMVVTRLDGAMGTQNPGTVSVFGGGLFGLTKSLNQEWVKVYCRGVDLDPEIKAEMASEKILAELYDADQCIVDTCYNAQGERHTLLAVRMPDVDSTKLSTKVESDDVFLVSGGGRGVTARCVLEMASAYKCKFIIVGRSELTEEEPKWAEKVVETDELKRKAMEQLKAQGEKPLPKAVMAMVGAVQADREIKETLTDIRKNGGEAYYVPADVTDAESLKSGITEGVRQMGTITGIVHGAGRLADKLIENKTEADFDAVYDVKIKGLLAIIEAIDIATIKRVVLFSSVAGFYGNTGQTDYAIANEILNRAAHLFKKNHPDIHTVSINWGAWDSGMVSPELKKIFDDYQVSLVPTDEGPKAMVDQLSEHYASQAQVILGSTLPMAKTHTDGPLTTHRIHRTLLESANPFLKHHVIQGNAVLPIINASTWMAQTAADLYPGFHLFKAEKVKLFKGIVFDGNQADDYLVTLKELKKNEENVSVEVTISSENGATLPTNHYQAVISLASGRPEAPIMPLPDLSKIEVVQDDASGIYTDGTLFHGTDFQGVKKILQLDDAGVLLLCEHEGVSDQRQGQFPVKELNVFLTDVMYQSLLIWIRKFYDSASLPLSTDKVEIYRVFPFGKPFYVQLQVLKSDEFGMQADITAFDSETGEVYMKSSEARVTLSRDLAWD